MPNDTTTAVQHPPKTPLGLRTPSWLRTSSLDKHSCPYVGQWSSPTHPGQFHHDLSYTTFTDVNNGCHLQANHAPRVTPPINCACNLPKPRLHKKCVFQHKSHPCKTQASTTDMVCPHTASAMNRQLWLRQVLSAPGAEISSQKKTRNSTFRPNQKSAVQNSGPPPNHNMIKTQPKPLYVSPILVHLQPQRLELFSQHGRRAIEHARHRPPGALRLLRPLPGHLDDKLVVTTERQSGHNSAALHHRRLRSGGGFARTTLPPE